jgi:adenylate kinase
MRLILLGPPGCGKGTQAKLLAERLQLGHIGTGDIFRDAIRQRTALGIQAEKFVTAGKLVPDDLVNSLVAESFTRPDRPDCFVLDGYPRTLAQAEAFDAVLKRAGLNLSAVVHFLVSDDEIVERLAGRWSCPTCKTVYNASEFPPGAEKRCNRPGCGTLLVQRADDREDTVRERLRVYHQNTEPLVEHYRRQGKLRTIDGMGEIESVYARIVTALQQQAPNHK